MSGGENRRHSSFGFYVLSKTYIAIYGLLFLTLVFLFDFGDLLDFRLKRRKERQEVNVTNCQKSNDQ
jgi:hypothetical protein